VERGARLRARLLGFANRAAGRRPNYDPFNPVFDTGLFVRTMKAALDDAGISAGELSAVSANRSSSVFYDPLEAQAIAELLGTHSQSVPVYSIKGALGQTGAVTPALQAIAAALSIESGLIPPTCNLTSLDDKCPIKVVSGAPERLAVPNVLANAIGFGGFYYTSMVFGQ
jgi:3-oxoacyl-(acyl-carrier-protein) synthase